jgi:hypothetical protein
MFHGVKDLFLLFVHYFDHFSAELGAGTFMNVASGFLPVK